MQHRSSCTCLCLIVLAACAGAPPKPAEPPAVATPPQASAGAATNSVLTPQVIDKLKHQGYAFKKSNGQDMYCRTDPVVGSHIATTTTCLTVRQAQEATERAQQAVTDTTHEAPFYTPAPGR